MTFERSEDWALVKSIVTHPRLWPWVSDDFSPKPEDWQPINDPRVWHVVCRDGAEVLGLWILGQHTAVVWTVHTCLLPNAWGQRAKQAVRQAIEWVWRVSPCVRLITEVPAYNRLALQFAKKAGMTEYGLNPKSYAKDKSFYDVILLGISRPGHK